MVIMNSLHQFFDSILNTMESSDSGAGAAAILSKLLNWIQ
jgi:hypothetical protein